MKALMAVGQVLTMSSREIAELTGKEHPNVMRDIRSMLLELGEDVLKFEDIYADAYGREQPCFNLPKDLTITLVAGYNVQMRHAIVKRWQELEAQQAPKVPQTYAQALLEAGRLAQLAEEQAQQLALAAPKVEFVDKFVQASTGSKGFREVCKLLNANEAEFRCFLIDRGVMYRLGGKWMPYAQHLDAGRFEVKAGVAKNDHAYNTAKFTAKGVGWIAGEWAKAQVREVASAPGN